MQKTSIYQRQVNKRIKIEDIRFSLWIIIILLFSSCTSLSKLGISEYPNDNITKNNYSELDGLYSNSHDTILGKLEHFPYDGYSELARLENYNILNQLFLNIPKSSIWGTNCEIISPKEKWIKIEFQSSRKANITMYHNDKFVFSKEIHGKFKNGYFYLRPKIFVMPLIPLLFGYNFERARIGKSKDNLLIDYSINMWGFAIAAGSSDKGYASSVYKKKQ